MRQEPQLIRDFSRDLLAAALNAQEQQSFWKSSRLAGVAASLAGVAPRSEMWAMCRQHLDFVSRHGVERPVEQGLSERAVEMAQTLSPVGDGIDPWLLPSLLASHGLICAAAVSRQHALQYLLTRLDTASVATAMNLLRAGNLNLTGDDLVNILLLHAAWVKSGSSEVGFMGLPIERQHSTTVRNPRDNKSRLTDLVRGRRVAIVGPSTIAEEDREAIEAADLIVAIKPLVEREDAPSMFAKPNIVFMGARELLALRSLYSGQRPSFFKQTLLWLQKYPEGEPFGIPVQTCGKAPRLTTDLNWGANVVYRVACEKPSALYVCGIDLYLNPEKYVSAQLETARRYAGVLGSYWPKLRFDEKGSLSPISRLQAWTVHDLFSDYDVFRLLAICRNIRFSEPLASLLRSSVHQFASAFEKSIVAQAREV